MLPANTIILGANRDVVRSWPDNGVDAIVTDPPYGLSKEPDIAEVLTHWLAGDDYTHTGGGFMGKTWDSFVPGPATWRQLYRVLKPGGFLLCFASSRTFDLMGISLRMAGFEMHPCISWVFAQGFPKAANLGKAIDKAAGAERQVVEQRRVKGGGTEFINRANQEQGYRPSDYAKGENVLDITAPATDLAKQWEGWAYGKQALKPAMEPILMAQKPYDGKPVDSILTWGVGALNINGCRVAGSGPHANAHREGEASRDNRYADKGGTNFCLKPGPRGGDPAGRWPANVVHDGSDEVLVLFPDTASGSNNVKKASSRDEQGNTGAAYGDESRPAGTEMISYGDKGSAARFFNACPVSADDIAIERMVYCAKASRSERDGGLEDQSDQVLARSTQAQAQARRGNKTRRGRRAFNKARLVRNNHPTVKPLALMRHLVRLVTPPGGLVLDPFCGSGSTCLAAAKEGLQYIGIEHLEDYVRIARARLGQGGQP